MEVLHNIFASGGQAVRASRKWADQEWTWQSPKNYVSDGQDIAEAYRQ